MSIYEKLFSIQGLKVKKDTQNPFFKSQYSSLEGIMSTLLPILEENELLIYHHTENKEVLTTLISKDGVGFS